MQENTIPKRIFYVWGAGEPKRRDVDLCILSWREKCPEYEIIEINENSKEYFNFQEELKKNKWFRTVYENKLYAFIADYIRVKVLYDNGGIYLDTDVSVVRNFDDVINNPAFVGIQQDTKYNPNILEPAILGAQKGNDSLKRIVDFYEKKIWELPLFSIPEIMQYVLEDKYGKIEAPPKDQQTIIKLYDITIYPERFFIPKRAKETFNISCIEPDTHTIHWNSLSWGDESIVYFVKHKHEEDLDILLKKCFNKKIIFENLMFKIEKQVSKIDISINLSYMIRFQYYYYKDERYLTLLIFGNRIKLWRK